MSQKTGQPAHLRSWLLVGTTLALLVLHACTLSRDGTATQECTGDGQCEDGNPCTEDICNATGFCESAPTVVTVDQVPGDCLLAQCQDGVVVQVPIDDPEDDANDCTVDLCEDGVSKHNHLPDGANCEITAGPGHCVLGECKVDCAISADCDDLLDCTEDLCDAVSGYCEYLPLDNVLAPLQIAGDCHQTLCDAGVATPLIDDTDLPIDGETCTYDLCNQGVPSNPPLPVQDPCVASDPLAKVCDDVGSCVQCNGPSDCTHLPPDDDCKQRVCNVVGDCVQYNTPIHTPINQQQPGDCQRVVCDGNGGTQIDADDADLPVDGNACTQDLCSGGVASNPPEPQGTACGGGVCNGDAVTPLCQDCNVPSDCGSTTFCRVWTCPSGVCTPIDTANNTPLPAPDQIAEDCLEVQCNGSGSTKTVQIDDPIVDGIECTDDLCNGGTPVNPSRPINTPCTQGGGNYCDGALSCVECNADAQCTGDDGVCEQDLCQSHSCNIVSDPPGTPAPVSFQSDGDCLTVVCDGAGAVDPTPLDENADLPVDGNQCTADQCNSGVPANPEEPAGTGCSQNGGTVCNGDPGAPACVECADSGDCSPTESCDVGLWVCELNDGQGCGLPSQCFSGFCVDTLCCNSLCSGSCEACNLSGTPGVCSPVPFGQDPAAECAGGACDGLGACKLDDGQVCAAGSDCLSGVCVDGLCCDVACGGSCEACNLPATPGVCSPVPFGQDPAAECATGACDGAGTCKLDLGEVCGVGNDCLSGFCVDGICCGSGCADTCEACVGAGVCTPHTVGTDPESECGADVCGLSNSCRCADLSKNGAESDVDCGGGVCSTCAAGRTCNQPSDCDSGVCSGGVCQAPSCGDGVVNGGETCDWGDPATPCCAVGCNGTAPLDTVCGVDPDASGCAAPPRCSGVDISLASCQSRTQPDSTLCTTNGLFCDGAEVCQGGSCVSPGNPCQGADGDANCAETCNEGADNCSAPDPNGSPCSDGVYCNGTEICNSGLCGSSTGDPCAGADGDADCNESCDEGSDSCGAYDGNGAACDDAAYCNGADTCQGGTCSGHAGDPCAGPDGDADCNESCDEGSDSCSAYDGDGAGCSDGSFCNGTESCGGGACGSSTGDPCLGPDGDADCNESCDEGSDSCSAYDGDFQPCDDTLWCNGTDVCAAGSCSQHVGDPCLGPDGDADCNESCDEGSDSCSAYDGDFQPCDDTLWCNGMDVCATGSCSQHVGDPCLGPDGDDDCNESCDEGSDSCSAYDGDTAVCEDFLYCNGADTCGGGTCSQHGGDPCPGPDGDDVCNESCDEGSDSCSAYDGDGAVCDDGYSCTPVDACGGGVCVGSGSVCGDGTVCPPTEVCDDNNVLACGTCSADCQTDQSSPPPNDCVTGDGCVVNDDCTNSCSSGLCN